VSQKNDGDLPVGAQDQKHTWQAKWRKVERLAHRCGLQFREFYREDDIPDQWRSDILGNVGYAPRSRTICIVEDCEIFIHALHEVCHWLVATPKERTLVNWGYQSVAFQPPVERERDAVDVTIGIVYLWGYAKDAQQLQDDLGAHDVTLAHCARVARQYLDKNGLIKKRRT
jgi:hypothetical protein